MYRLLCNYDNNKDEDTRLSKSCKKENVLKLTKLSEGSRMYLLLCNESNNNDEDNSLNKTCKNENVLKNTRNILKTDEYICHCVIIVTTKMRILFV